MSDGPMSFNWKLNLLLFVAILSTIAVAVKKIPAYPYGDGTEYILMSEALYNHASPDLRPADLESYINRVESSGRALQKEGVFRDMRRLFKEENKTGSFGFFIAENEKAYCYHFWTYSLLNLPAWIALDMMGEDVSKSFLITNILMMGLVLLLIWSIEGFALKERVVLSLLFVFSPVLWYIAWPHPEVFASSAVFAALILFIRNRLYLSLFLFSIAAMHFPPLFIPALIVFVKILKEDIQRRKALNISTLVKLFFSSFWIVVPSLFYLHHFGVPNLIIEQGYISTENLDLKRLNSFFFDLNQGMVVGIPLLLFSLFVLLLRSLIRREWGAAHWFVLSIIPMGYFFLQMGNWNHGMAVINRYAVWNSVILIFAFYVLIKDLKDWVWRGLLLGVIACQILVVPSFIDYNNIFWGAGDVHNRLAETVLNEYPELYNPDPTIFRCRTNMLSLSTTDSVVVHTRPDGVINKMLVREGGAIKQLLARGIEEDVLEPFKSELDYYHGWAYINLEDLNRLGYVQEKDTFIAYTSKMNIPVLKERYREQIRNDHNWMKQIEEKADKWGQSVEETIEQDIEWLIKNEGEN